MIGGFYEPGTKFELISHEEALRRKMEMQYTQKEAEEKIARDIMINILEDIRKEFAKKMAGDIMNSMKGSEVFQTAKTKIIEHLTTTMEKVAGEEIDTLLFKNYAEKIAEKMADKKSQKNSD